MCARRNRTISHRLPGASRHFGVLILAALCSFSLAAAESLRAADGQVHHWRCDVTSPNANVTRLGVRDSVANPGPLLAPLSLPNAGSWEFDGERAIAKLVSSNTAGLAENFTWEGFFRFPASNTFLSETGIADRLVTQFAFDKGDWTRLAIGLVADRDGAPRLSVELEGFEGRTFGLGRHIVAAEHWHHFALVHEGTAAAARIRWYLDYQVTGELFLGGQANQNTLRPPGTAPLTIGARLRTADRVNRGFAGLIDEIRLTPQPLPVEQFLRCEGTAALRPDEPNVSSRQRRPEFWSSRHGWARQEARRWAYNGAAPTSLDALVRQPREPLDDAAFLRRLSLTVRGRIPTLDEVREFLSDRQVDRRVRAIDRLLASPEWADGWVGYWQDVLAENPSVVFPTLNNSGAFRQWIYNAFRDNMPWDRFATELILMEGTGDHTPAGFALATGNDAPMAMRSQVVLKAFAGVDLKCARCHDSPLDDFPQADLFLLAAYLNGGPLQVPATSVAAVGKAKVSGVITTSLAAGQRIEPHGLTARWLKEAETINGLRPIQTGPRAELAALITSPRNRRFSDVIVNRLWKRYFGSGLVEPVDQWPLNHQDTAASATANATTNSPDGELVTGPELTRAERDALLHVLSSDFVTQGYDLKLLARRILVSELWQGRRRQHEQMSAEQLVDSLFMAVGKTFQAETLGVHATDAGAVQLPRPDRAWQFAALPNERDRPALGMPVNQTIVDVMAAFGWTGNRQQPRSQREQATSAHQALMLFNGLMSQRITRLSDQSRITELCLRAESPGELVEQLFLLLLSRYPSQAERQHFVSFLSPGFAQRCTGKPIRAWEPLSTFQPDWRTHLEAEQTRQMLAARQRVARGEPPTERLTEDFRERAEDVVWALINSPEFVVIP